MRVEESERADEAVKIAAETRDIRVSPEWFTSLTQIGRTVTERKWKDAKHWFRNRQKSHSHIKRAQYDLVLDTQGLDEEARWRQAQISHRCLQLKSKHALTDTFLKPIGNRVSDRCWGFDSRSLLDIHYIMFRCAT